MPELVTARILAVLTVLLSIVMPFAVIEAPLLTNTVSSANNVIVFGMLITTVPFTATFAALIVMLLFAPDRLMAVSDTVALTYDDGVRSTTGKVPSLLPEPPWTIVMLAGSSRIEPGAPYALRASA